MTFMTVGSKQLNFAARHCGRSVQTMNRSGGFTLVEMIAVILLIGLVMSFATSKMIENFNRGKYNTAKVQLRRLEGAVSTYQGDNGAYPQQLNDLLVRPGNAGNWTGPYVKESDLKDPFGHPFTYKVPGDHGDFDLIFLGKDGQAGGDGLNKDFGIWE